MLPNPKKARSKTAANRFDTARRRRRPRQWIVICAAITALVLAVFIVWVVWFSSWLAVGQVTVSGHSSLKKDQIINQADIADHTPLARVDPTAVESRVSELSRVERVKVSRSWPRSIRIRVVERQAIAWTKVDGEARAIDRHGVDFRGIKKPSDDLIELDVPKAGAERRDALQAAAKVVHSLRTQDKDFLEHVTKVQAASRDSVELDIGDQRSVRWGSPDEVIAKLRVLRALLDSVKATHYDVSAPARPTTEK